MGIMKVAIVAIEEPIPSTIPTMVLIALIPVLTSYSLA